MSTPVKPIAPSVAPLAPAPARGLLTPTQLTLACVVIFALCWGALPDFTIVVMSYIGLYAIVAAGLVMLTCGWHDLFWSGGLCRYGRLCHRLGLYCACIRPGIGGHRWYGQPALGGPGVGAGIDVCRSVGTGLCDAQAVGALSAAVHDCLGAEPVLPVWQHAVLGGADGYHGGSTFGRGRLVVGITPGAGCRYLGSAAGVAVVAAQPARFARGPRYPCPQGRTRHGRVHGRGYCPLSDQAVCAGRFDGGHLWLAVCPPAAFCEPHPVQPEHRY